MSLVQGFLLTALAALVVLHMASPRFRRLRLSSARFFHDLPPADDARRRFQLGKESVAKYAESIEQVQRSGRLRTLEAGMALEPHWLGAGCGA